MHLVLVHLVYSSSIHLLSSVLSRAAEMTYQAFQAKKNQEYEDVKQKFKVLSLVLPSRNDFSKRHPAPSH